MASVNPAWLVPDTSGQDHLYFKLPLKSLLTFTGVRYRKRQSPTEQSGIEALSIASINSSESRPTATHPKLPSAKES
ncbi:hypothetical protein [Pseudomonas donghuensis]|uniref:hypothetical protein n=1 Tax=Pseudomonas donghuensis TaxID=1163398 RepID=UPI0020C4CEC5|nr:hypothetical protein [Pseudomonas donghuensis]MCP6697714.1 hypothetical protein [Pseudomonas donghuensis]